MLPKKTPKKLFIFPIVYTLQVESLSYQTEWFHPPWWNFLSLTVCARRKLSLGHSKERHTAAPEAQQLRRPPAPLSQTWRWSWSMGRSWENGEQNTGNGQNGYSFPLLWSFIFHFCESQYIVETFPRFTINPDYLPPLSMDFSLFSFLEAVRGRRLKTLWHGTFLPFFFFFFGCLIFV